MTIIWTDKFPEGKRCYCCLETFTELVNVGIYCLVCFKCKDLWSKARVNNNVGQWYDDVRQNAFVAGILTQEDLDDYEKIKKNMLLIREKEHLEYLEWCKVRDACSHEFEFFIEIFGYDQDKCVKCGDRRFYKDGVLISNPFVKKENLTE